MQEINVSVTRFNSGCKRLCARLEKERREEKKREKRDSPVYTDGPIPLFLQPIRLVCIAY